MAFPAQMFPFLNASENETRSVESWRELWLSTARSLVDFGDSGVSFRNSNWQLNAGVIALMMKGYPQAKRELIKAGYKIEGDRIIGRTYFGFQTSRFEKGIKFIFNKGIKSNTKEEIVLGSSSQLWSERRSNGI